MVNKYENLGEKMSLTKRICLVSMPRSGSTHCLNRIAQINDGNYVGEIIDTWDRIRYFHDEDNRIRFEHVDYDCRPILNWRANLELIRTANVDDNIHMKWFMREPYRHDMYYFRDYGYIYDTLKDAGFTFIMLDRDYAETAVSWVIAQSYWEEHGTNIYGVNSTINKKVTVTADTLVYALNTLRGRIYYKYFTERKLADAPKIKYETMDADINRIFNVDLPPSPNTKTIKGDPYDWIVNADEVRTAITAYSKQLFD